MRRNPPLSSTRWALTVGIVILSATGTSMAQSMDRLSEVDANGDGNIEWQELLDMRAATFRRLDRNSDGYIDNEDSPRMAAVKARFEEARTQLQPADADGDGRISREEMLNGPAPLFIKGDTNGDKVLSASEIAAMRASSPVAR